ncbi:hypothetical protein [Calidithermus timidus]|uniref:hypothetical protein n=1 Tax=Calidithermus timidus TaxID=307124 RepID=UPI0003684C08|nr:hypothetical protein [Calidithermus timidus]
MKDERPEPDLDALQVDVRQTYHNLLQREGELYVRFYPYDQYPGVVVEKVDHMGYRSAMEISPDVVSIVQTWGSDTYWDRWWADKEAIYYGGTVDNGEYRVMPDWVAEFPPHSPERIEALAERLGERLHSFLAEVNEKEAKTYDLKATVLALLEEGYRPNPVFYTYEGNPCAEVVFQKEGDSKTLSIGPLQRVETLEGGEFCYEPPTWLKKASLEVEREL